MTELSDMIEVEVVRDLDHPAALMWRFLSWRGVANIKGKSFFERISFQDDLNAVGSVRVLHFPDGTSIPEVAEELDDAGMSYAYRPLSMGSLPATDYVGGVRIFPLGPSRCRVSIRSRCRPKGISAQGWRDLYTSMESDLITLIDRQARELDAR